MNPVEIADLEERAREARRLTVEMIGGVGSGHLGGALSVIDLLVTLYFRVLRVYPDQPDHPDRDRFILSKGHAGPGLYAVLAMRGYFDRSMLQTLNRLGTRLPSHCDMTKTPGVDMTAGSLGQGLSAAVGMAIAGRLDRKSYRVYCALGDGECQEGQVWEAAMLASQHKLTNLIAFVDHNKMQIDGTLADINDVAPLERKWDAFGWSVQSADGHSVGAIAAAIENAKANTSGPSMIVLHTLKGRGVSFAEGKLSCHSMPVTADHVALAMKELA